MIEDDTNIRIAQTRVANCERQLLRAQDHYEKQCAQAALDQALHYLELLKGAERG